METRYVVGTYKDLSGYKGFIKVYNGSVYIFTEYSKIVRLCKEDALDDADSILNNLIVSNPV